MNHESASQYLGDQTRLAALRASKLQIALALAGLRGRVAEVGVPWLLVTYIDAQDTLAGAPWCEP